MESSSAQASLGEGSKNGSQASRYVAAIEDMFWVCDKSRPDSSDAERIPDHRVRQGRQGRVEFPDFKDGKVAESSTKPTQCGLPNRSDPPGLGLAGRRPQAAGLPTVARTCDGGAGVLQPSRSGPPVRDLTGCACGRHQCRPSFLFPRLGESFRC
jgi:hypothetical protein